jgi:hypothetical protein
MKDTISTPKGVWLRIPSANLIPYAPSGIYFSRLRVKGKLIRRSLKTKKTGRRQASAGRFREGRTTAD